MSTTQITLAPPPPAGRLQRALASHWAALPVVLAGTFMVVLDFFIVNVALPSMQADLGASAGAVEWVVAGYAPTSALFLLTPRPPRGRFRRPRRFALRLAGVTP